VSQASLVGQHVVGHLHRNIGPNDPFSGVVESEYVVSIGGLDIPMVACTADNGRAVYALRAHVVVDALTTANDTSTQS
jgi:hypothetical protein